MEITKAFQAFNSLSDEIDPDYQIHGIRTDERLRTIQDFIDPIQCDISDCISCSHGSLNT